MNRFLVLACWVAGMASMQACSVPVFNYALTHWEADSHELALPAGSLDPAAFEARIAAFHANLRLGPEGSGELRLADGRPWCTGPFDPAAITRLMDSPARRELARRLCQGDSVVWLLVRGSDPAADARVEDRLRSRLAELARLIELPVADPDDPQTAEQERLAGPQLRIGFSLLTLDPRDPAEAGLVAQITALADGVTSTDGVAVAVFGRGRALRPIPSTSLSNAMIDDTTTSLCAACSCLVKAANPGTDLLISWDWDGALEQAADARHAVAPQSGPVQSSEDPRSRLEVLVVSPSAAGQEPAQALWSTLGGALICLVLISTGMVLRRRRQSQA